MTKPTDKAVLSNAVGKAYDEIERLQKLLLKHGGHSVECRRDRALYEAGYGCKATGSKTKFTCCCGWDDLRKELE